MRRRRDRRNHRMCRHWCPDRIRPCDITTSPPYSNRLNMLCKLHVVRSYARSSVVSLRRGWTARPRIVRRRKIFFRRESCAFHIILPPRALRKPLARLKPTATSAPPKQLITLDTFDNVTCELEFNGTWIPSAAGAWVDNWRLLLNSGNMAYDSARCVANVAAALRHASRIAWCNGHQGSKPTVQERPPFLAVGACRFCTQ